MGRHGTAAEQDPPEPGDVDPGLQQPAQHRRDEGNDVGGLLCGDRGRIEAGMQHHRTAGEASPHQDHHSGDVARRNAAQPPVPLPQLQPRGGGEG